MRRHRPTHYSLAFLTAVGIAAVPSTAGADDEPAAAADESTAVAEPVPAPPTTQVPPRPETTEPPKDPEPPATTTPDEPEAPAPSDTTPTTPGPEPTPRPVDETPAPQPTTPAPSEPAQPSAERSTESTAPEVEEDDDELDVEVPDALPDVTVVRPISFPVLGPVRYANDWGNCRAGCARRHQGTDLIGVRMQPLLAAVDGTVTRVRYENRGTAGSVISITGADGWYYNYFHVNNDTPGSDDGAAGPEWQVAPGLTVGSPVRAGQVIGYMGDSGNAEGSVPHLHFEIRQPDRTPVNPYHSLVAAEGTCAPDDALSLVADPTVLTPAAVAVIPIDGGGRWLIDADGLIFAEGPAARLAGIACDYAVLSTGSVDTLLQAAAPIAVAEAPIAETATTGLATAPAATATAWTVERGQSLWNIVQEAYGVSDDASTVSLVNFVFDHNRDLLADPNSLDVGMTLELPPLTF